MYSKHRAIVNKWLQCEEVAAGELVFTAGDVARWGKMSIVTARKWLQYYVKYSGGWLVGERHPYNSNNHVIVYRVVKGISDE